MTTQTTDTAIQFDLKSGKGIRDGVVSELATFFDIRPGHEDVLRAAVKRFTDGLSNAPMEETMKTGLRYTKFVIFDGGTRLLWITAFETDWDPYVEDAFVVVGMDNFIDWIQHTTAYEHIEAWMRESGGAELFLRARGSGASDPEHEKTARKNSRGLKQIVMSAQIPAVSYYDALSDKTMPEIRRALRVNQAFQQVLDGPDAAEALQQPALEPLLDLAAD
jgi:hypothetical protein